MYIRRLVIRNFRAVRHLDLRLQPGLTCIIGENNTGKTTILHALRLVLDAGLSNTYRQLAREDFSDGLDITSPQQILISVELTDFKRRAEEEALVSDWAVEDDVARVCYRFRPRPGIREAIESGDRQEGTLTIDDYSWQLAGTGPNDPATIQWTDELVGTVRFDRLTAFHVTFLQALRDVEEDLRRSRFSPLTKLLDAASLSEPDKMALLANVRTANEAIKTNPAIKTIGKSIETSLTATVGEVFKMGVNVGVADPTFAALTRSLVLLLTTKGLSDADPSRSGLGLNNALYISMLMEVFRQRASKPNVAGQLLLVEEPEAHLHPELQRIVFSHLLANNCQVVATTHSTHVTSQAPLANIAVLTQTDTPATSSVVPCDGCGLVPREQKDLERYLDATRSTLLFSRRVVLVEGMSEVFLIPPLVKHLLGIDLQREGIGVIAIHGTHFPSYAKLFKPGGIEKRCVVIADGDLDLPEPEADEGAPDDGTPDPSAAQEPSVDVLAALKAMRSDFFDVFHCQTTFELALATPGNLKMFAETCTHLGAPRLAAKLLKAAADPSLTVDRKASCARSVLASAKRFGKARFAQVASQYVTQAQDVPPYIREGLAWLRR